MMIDSMTVEGSLEILWLNAGDPRVTPRYDLIFSRYAGFKNGAQQPGKVVGPAALVSYLINLGFTAEDAQNWVKQVHQKLSVSIRNVMLPDQHLADYGL
jgi:hypothetical protein